MVGEADDAISIGGAAAERRAVEAADLPAALIDAVTTDDICTFIYTSGTTGPPKGCVISHGNYRSMLDMVNETSVIESEDLTYLYLPLAHSFALLIQLGSFDLGATIAYWERDPKKIMPNLAELKPTYFPSVPRIFEKIYTAANSGMEKEGGLKKAIFDWSIKVGKKMREVERAGRKPGWLLQRQYAFADKKVLSKIRGLFGGNLRLAVSGAAPINPDILRFFDAAGVLVVEGWGMTETSTAATIATRGRLQVRHDRQAVPRLRGEDRRRRRDPRQGPERLPGLPQEPRGDGARRSSTAGSTPATSARSTREGFIKITGRKKDIIITAGGKNITPANLEAEISSTRWSPSASWSATAGPTWSPWSPSTPKRRSPTPKSTASPRTRRSWPPTPRSARRSKPTSRRSTRNSPGSSR